MSHKDITLAYSGISRDVTPPEYPYTSTLRLPFEYFRGFDGSYTAFDNGAAYDTRICECTFLFDATDRNAFETFFTGTPRGQTLSLTTVSGFYPFGPDKGDSGTFTARILSAEPTGQLLAPWKHWRVSLTLAMVSAPAYSLPTEISDGSMSLGSVSGVKYPQDGFEVDTSYGLNTIFTQGGDVYTYDFGTSADSYETTMQINGNHTKIAAIVNYLASTSRTNNFTLTAATGQYPFGYAKGDNTSFTVKLLSPELSVQHIGPDEFTLSISLGYIS